MVGRTLGHYRILEKIGAGGMGEVYRALDTKLGREVAIKVLPEALARHPERLARLRREAQVLAALNHPNIAAIYDLDECAGECLLALELVPGPTLAERLNRGPLAWREALGIGRQIAEALEAAHEKGIVHRDLKPANVKVTPAGQVKLLDFGLAKANLAGGASSGGAELATETQMTEAGAVLGTMAYMSPEQARGEPVDARSDIWAFGCVLYEMLAGRRLFAMSNASEIMAAILRDELKLDGLPADTPAGIRLLTERLLRRDLHRRLRDIGDARIEIEDALAGVSTAAVAPPRRTGIPAAVWLMGGVLLAALVGGGWWLSRRPAQATARNVQFERITDFVGMEESPAMSPDGKTVSFVALAKGRRQVWIRLLAGGTPLQITHDDADHLEPRWMPDSSSLIYYTPSSTMGGPGTIWEISALGGAPRRIGSALGGGDVSHDGRLVAVFQSQGGRTALATFNRDGSGGERVVRLLDERVYDHPRWSPDDRWIAFRRGLADVFDEAIYIVPATGGEVREVAHLDGLKGLSWLPDGSGLVYASSTGSTILYPPIYNLRTIRRDGSGERQLTFGDVSYVEPDVHRSGKLLASRVRIQSDIWKFPVGGSPLENTNAGVRITRQTGQAQTPSVSPDGKEVVYLSDNGGHGNLWVTSADGSMVRQITFERDPSVVIGVPVWSPAGDEIVFILTRGGKTGEWLVHPDGSGLRQLVVRGSGACWSRDGRWLYYCVLQKGGYCIEKVLVAGGPPVSVRCDNAQVAAGLGADLTMYFQSQPKGALDFELRKARPENGPLQVMGRIASSRIPVDPALWQPVLSPDGRWLAMPLLSGTTSNLWVLPTDGGDMRQLTDFGERSIIIARRVSWSPDAKYLYAAVAESDADVVLMDGLLP